MTRFERPGSQESREKYARLWFYGLAKFHRIENAAVWEFDEFHVRAFLCSKLEKGMPTWKRIKRCEGHSDIATTMIYTHVLNRPDSRIISPLDRLASAERRPARKSKQRTGVKHAQSAKGGVRPTTVSSKVVASVAVAVASELPDGESSHANEIDTCQAMGVVAELATTEPDTVVMRKRLKWGQRLKTAVATFLPLLRLH